MTGVALPEPVDPFPQRIRPDKGVVIKERQPTLVFATVCTEATYWKIGPYIIVPIRGSCSQGMRLAIRR